AVAERARLGALAETERGPPRPIPLSQAEPKNREVPVEVSTQHLIDDHNLHVDQIVIATGDQRGRRGAGPTAHGWRIGHIITVEALDEWWGCPAASDACSVARTKSSRSGEQRLGRGLRMPYASRGRAAALNRACARASGPTFSSA